MPSDEPLSDRCGAHTDGGFCTKYPSDGSTRCRLHGGASTGPKDTTHLEGNDFSKGNPGGGAPPLNTNATKSGAFGDLAKVDARLSGEAAEYVNRMYAETLARARVARPFMAPERRQRLAREQALVSYQSRLASADFFDRGPGIETEIEVPVEGGGTATATGYKANPTIERSCALSRRQRELFRVLGLNEHERINRHRARHGEIEAVDLGAEEEADTLRELGEA